MMALVMTESLMFHVDLKAGMGVQSRMRDLASTTAALLAFLAFLAG